MALRSNSSSRGSTQVEQRTIELGHPELTAVQVRVRRGRRTRHVRLHVDEQGEVTASVPARFPAARLDPIVRERADWLHEVLTRMRRKARDTQIDVERGDAIRWMGRWIPTTLERVDGRRAYVWLEPGDAAGEQVGERLMLQLPTGWDAHDALLAWYRREAREVFEQHVATWSERLGLRAGKVTIREQRTRWGSCTHRGDLSFNWRLVLAPEWVLESIVVHELCHIEELNHSDRFWALLDARFPRHREASEWLREHGASLRVTRAEGEERGMASAEDAAVEQPRVSRMWPSRGPVRAVPAEQLTFFDAE